MSDPAVPIYNPITGADAYAVAVQFAQLVPTTKAQLKKSTVLHPVCTRMLVANGQLNPISLPKSVYGDPLNWTAGSIAVFAAVMNEW